ncbi:MAG: arylsulfatase A-like enzyme [Cognaticolwellia sp.]
MLPFALLFACNSPELPTPSAQLPGDRLTQESGGSVVHLALLADQATIHLPESNRPKDAPPPGSVVLNTGWRRAGSSAYERVSPEGLNSSKDYRTSPLGVRLLQGDSELRFGRDWSIRKGKLRVEGSDPSDAEQPVIYLSDELSEHQGRLDMDSAGLSQQDFVQAELEERRGDVTHTRTGLLLPAPGSFEVRLTLPQAAELHLGLALTSPEGGSRSDGAHARVLVNGEKVAEWNLHDSELRDEVVDLSSFAGESVTLTLESEVRGSEDWDYVFFGSPMVVGAPVASPRRVVVIGIDTLRYAEMTQHGYEVDTTAALDGFADSSLIFDKAWAPAPRTRPSFRSSTTGRYPIKAVDADSFGSVFQMQGFVTAGITANVHVVPRFDFNQGYDFWAYENAADADVQLGRAKDFIQDNAGRDQLLFLHLMDPHNFYRAPGRYEDMYATAEQGEMTEFLNRWQVMGSDSKFSDENRLWLKQRYDGEVRYMADQLSEWLAWLLQQPGETLIVLHSDHGEEFWEHGGYEHNHSIYEEVVHANLWIRPPGGWAGGHRVSEPVSLIDIAPTLYDMLGVSEEDWPEVDGRSLRPLLDVTQAEHLASLKEELTARPLHVGYPMYTTELWGVIFGEHKYILSTWDGHEELYDLGEDPGESKDLSEESDLSPYWAAMTQSTGFVTGTGIRIRVESADTGFVAVFDHPVQVVVMDPEAQQSRRANVEWGEVLSGVAADVGLVDLAPDGRSFRFTPGTTGRGTLMVSAPSETQGTIIVGEQALPLSLEKATRVGKVRLRAERGTVILVTDSIAERAKVMGGRASDMEDELRALGYIQD